MNDEIKEILSKMERLIVYGQYNAYYDLEKQLLDCITNLQQKFENSYTEEQLDFAVNEVKEQLKAEHQLTNQLHNEIDKLRIKNYELQQEKEDYKSRVEKALDKIQYIIDYGFDYDGLNNVEDLKGLIDMLVNYARESKDILRGKNNES